MKKTFIISTAGGRKEGYINLINSLKDYAANGWGIITNFQKYSDEDFEEAQIKLKEIFGNNFISERSEELTGCHLARIPLLEKYQSDLWVLIDDDMEIVPSLTNYEKIGDILMNHEEIGLMVGKSQYDGGQFKLPIIRDKIYYKPVVFTKGGMCFRDDIAQIIKTIPKLKYKFDNPVWSTYVYINGYRNCEYEGSWAIHKMGSNGGGNRWRKEQSDQLVELPSEYMKTIYRQFGNKKTQVCTSKCFTPLVFELHQKNKKY